MRAGRVKRTFRQRLRTAVNRFLSWLLEDRALQGLGGPPNMHQMSPGFKSRQYGMSTSTHRFGAHFGNDAFDIMIYRQNTDEDRSRWVLMMAAEDFRKIALWYLWRWAWGEWFGLRRRLFYWRLMRRTTQFPHIRT